MKKIADRRRRHGGRAPGWRSQRRADAAKAKQLAQKYNCLACHAVDKKLVGPAYDEVAKKYKGDTVGRSTS